MAVDLRGGNLLRKLHFSLDEIRSGFGNGEMGCGIGTGTGAAFDDSAVAVLASDKGDVVVNGRLPANLALAAAALAAIGVTVLLLLLLLLLLVGRPKTCRAGVTVLLVLFRG